jgi:hypothetical protein
MNEINNAGRKEFIFGVAQICLKGCFFWLLADLLSLTVHNIQKLHVLKMALLNCLAM